MSSRVQDRGGRWCGAGAATAAEHGRTSPWRTELGHERIDGYRMNSRLGREGIGAAHLGEAGGELERHEEDGVDVKEEDDGELGVLEADVVD